MKPMLLLRIAARRTASSWAVSGPSMRYSPSLGTSSRPRIASKVDLPEPDGPLIETNSPLAIASSAADSARISTSSVWNTLAILCSSSSGRSGDGRTTRSLRSGLVGAVAVASMVLLDPETVLAVPLRHVREHDLIPGGQSAGDLDILEGGAAELDGDAVGAAVAVELEQRRGLVRLADRGARDVEDVAGVGELDHALDVLVDARGLGRRRGQLDVDGDAAVLRGRVDAHDLAGDHAVAGVDRGLEAEREVLGRRLGDAQPRLQAIGDHDLGQRCADRDGLADLDRDLLHHADLATAHVDRAGRPAAKGGESPHPPALRMLGLERWGVAAAQPPEPLLLELGAADQLAGAVLGLEALEVGDQIGRASCRGRG